MSRANVTRTGFGLRVAPEGAAGVGMVCATGGGATEGGGEIAGGGAVAEVLPRSVVPGVLGGVGCDSHRRPPRMAARQAAPIPNMIRRRREAGGGAVMEGDGATLVIAIARAAGLAMTAAT
jgi:hypothetical protein